MLDRIRFRSVFAAAALCLLSQPTLAWFAPPTIEPTYIDLFTKSSSDATIDGVTQVVEDPKSAYSPGFTTMEAYTRVTGPDGAVADSEAFHQLYIGAYGISAAFFAGADADGVPDSETLIGSRALNEGEIRFSLPVDASVNISLFMSIDATGPAFFSGGEGLSRVVMTGTRPDGTTFTFSRLILDDAFENPVILETDRTYEVKANTEVVLSYTMSAFAGVIFDDIHYADTVCAFYVSVLDSETGLPVDADDDGIPDDWEENGVDVDGDGTIDIDLPAITAAAAAAGHGVEGYPGRRTLFVELDAHDGVPVDAAAVADVVRAFADSPVPEQDPITGEIVGSGVDLIFVIDDSTLPNEEYDGTAWPQAFDDAKAVYFGTAELRAKPNWETEIKPVYASIFRYGIWGQAMFRNEDDGDGGTKKVYFSGKAELPGNDFYVAAGDVATWYDARPELRTDALAGTLMHEFGHTLNLRHGGHENKNYKPNYLSVMNYAYQLPSRGTSAQGTDLSDAWVLDFARTRPAVLNENELREDQGYDGPAGRAMMFNVAEGDDPRSLLLVDADAPGIDWDYSQTPIQSEPVSVNLTRFRLSAEDDTLDAQLVALPDWDAIWYRVGGAPDFADGSHTTTSETSELSFDEFELLQTIVVNDLTTPSCTADLNGDGVADQGDIQAFITLFLVQDLAVDFNGDGIVDLGDIQGFIAVFLEGC